MSCVSRWKHAVGVGLAGLLIAGSASVGVLSAPPAAAASGDPPPPLSLRYLGSSSTIAFPGQQGEVSLSLAVPPNLTPTEIRGTAQFPSFVTCGNVDVLQGDRLISRTPIDPAVNSPIALPLRGVRLDRNSADIVLRTYLRTAGSCDFDADNRFRIVNAVVAYGGREATPARVAGFLPPILRALTIYVPEDVKPAEGAAAVQLATAVVANYGSAAVDIRTASLPRNETRPAAAVGPLERQVVISTDAPAGRPEPRTGSRMAGVANRRQPRGAGDAGAVPHLGAVEHRDQFGRRGRSTVCRTATRAGGQHTGRPGCQRSTGHRRRGMAVDLLRDRPARLGRPSEDVRVQLSGTYTPLGGQIAVTVGPRVIASVPADPSGRYNTWVDIPPDLLARFTEVTVTYNHPDVGEGCGTGTRTSLSLASTGEVRSESADPPRPSGFASLPQALMPRTALAWTDGGVDDVRRAVVLMTGLQRLSAVRLGIDVMPVADAMSSNGPIVIVAADGQGVPELPLPVEATGGTLSVLGADGERSNVVLNPAVRFGSLQVARQDGRSVLLATSTGTAADLDALLTWLDADPDRWPSLAGDAVLQVAGQQPVVVVADQVAPDRSESSTGTSWVTVAVAAVGVVVATALATFLLRRRRRTSSGG
nr:hypothetical protein [Gordonia ajococcus]